jgi:uncharacterized protein (DUF4415 family)
MQQYLTLRDGRKIVLNTPKEDAAITAAAMSDPDALPLTDEEWAKVRPMARRRGRPLGSGSKVQVTLRIDAEVVTKFKADGSGWQTRMSDALKSWTKHHA